MLWVFHLDGFGGFLILSPPKGMLLILEGGEERERQKQHCERGTLTGCLLYAPNQEQNLKPKYLP